MHEHEKQLMRLSEVLLNARITMMDFARPDFQGETLRLNGLTKSAHYSAI